MENKLILDEEDFETLEKRLNEPPKVLPELANLSLKAGLLKQERQRIADLAIAEANKTRQTPGMEQAWSALMGFAKLIREKNDV